MIRKYKTPKMQTNLWHREEEPPNNHKTPEKTKKAKQPDLSFPSV